MPQMPQPSEFTVITTALCASFLVSFLNVYKHLTNFHEPSYQLHIVRIILIVPVYALQTYLSILLPNSSLIFNAVKDCYEAYVLYLFLQLLIQYLGGEQTLVAHYELQGRIKHPWPFTNSLRPIKLNRLFFRRVKQGTMQFMILKPFISITALVLHMEGFYEESNISWTSGYLYCSLLTNLSLTISLYALALFYIASEERLQIYKPFWKFISINGIISVAFWQSLGFSIMREMDIFGSHEDPESFKKAFYLENCLLLCEIFVAGVSHYFIFSYEEFVDLNKTPRPLLKNIGEILSMRDVIDDAKSNFVDEEVQIEHPMKVEYNHYLFEANYYIKVFSNFSEDSDEEEHKFLDRTKAI